MKLQNLRQAPFSTTMMGVMRGALDYFCLPASDAFLYGATGHAFVVNIHRELCPSSPYCWQRGCVEALAGNLGLGVERLGFFGRDSSPDQRAAAERRLRESLGSGDVAFLMNMENQLVTGEDETGFLTAQPWPGMDFPPGHLTFGTWTELGDEIHMDLYLVRKTEPRPVARSVRESLRYAVDLWRNPTAHSWDGYGVGPNGYANWMGALRAGHGAGHGARWNAMVWSECRARAAEYIHEIAPLLPPTAGADGVAAEYSTVASSLERCAGSDIATDEKLALLASAREKEERCIGKIEQALAAMP
jgi:hypothetical protein